MGKKDDLRDLNICMVAGAGQASLVISEPADLLIFSQTRFTENSFEWLLSG